MSALYNCLKVILKSDILLEPGCVSDTAKVGCRAVVN